MLLIWKIRYLNSKDKQFYDRCLWLETQNLDPVELATIELQLENASNDRSKEREWLKYRHLFIEGEVPEDAFSQSTNFSCFGAVNYFEDEHGNELSLNDIAKIKTGSPDAVAIPSGATQADINYMFSDKTLIDVKAYKLTGEQLKTLGYFTQDLQKLQASTMMCEGPGVLKHTGCKGSYHTVETVASEPEIESFMLTYRRLVSAGEPGGINNAVNTFSDIIGEHPLVDYVKTSKSDFDNYLQENLDFMSHRNSDDKLPNLTVKQLINTITYSNAAHQKSKHYKKSINEVDGDHNLLLYYCLLAVYFAATKLNNFGQHIAQFYYLYCQLHDVKPEIVQSIKKRGSGVGAKEPKKDLEERLFDEKVVKLAKALWEQKGCPSEGYMSFHKEACTKLKEAINPEQGEA